MLEDQSFKCRLNHEKTETYLKCLKIREFIRGNLYLQLLKCQPINFDFSIRTSRILPKICMKMENLANSFTFSQVRDFSFQGITLNESKLGAKRLPGKHYSWTNWKSRESKKTMDNER